MPGFDTLAITEQAAITGQKRVVADPSRLEEVEGWTRSDQVWTRHAALLMTLPWTRQRDPKPAERAVRERVLGWAEDYAGDGERQIQKVLAAWLCALSKRDPDRVRTFLDTHGGRMMPFARRSAARLLD
ncbi:DNA alkylation repair protein [Rhodovulum tesquicola]|nr:DNA alkylation repair protein [Rhodovulum tesquicola]